MVTAIYNEIDPFAARWLRNLIAAGHVAPGVVDERSIRMLAPADVAGSGQRHFFAGIAGWSLALRLAGVPDNADVWTGSCPCQSLSDAGKRLGFADERHLWPAWFRLIAECRPAVIFGEQVASSLGLEWLDLVFADLEGAGYACAAADLCAAGAGAPHQRQRLFFVAYFVFGMADSDGESRRLSMSQRQPGREIAQAKRHGETRVLADTIGQRRHGVPRDDGARRGQSEPVGGRASMCDCGHRASAHDFGADDCSECSCTFFLADAQTSGRGTGRLDLAHGRPAIEPDGHSDDSGVGNARRARGRRDSRTVSPTQTQGGSEWVEHRGVADIAVATGHDGWSACDWIPCSDNVSRPVEPGTHPLAHGVPGRVGLLRGYGNAIVPQVAAAFVRAALEATRDQPELAPEAA